MLGLVHQQQVSTTFLSEKLTSLSCAPDGQVRTWVMESIGSWVPHSTNWATAVILSSIESTATPKACHVTGDFRQFPLSLFGFRQTFFTSLTMKYGEYLIRAWTLNWGLNTIQSGCCHVNGLHNELPNLPDANNDNGECYIILLSSWVTSENTFARNNLCFIMLTQHLTNELSTTKVSFCVPCSLQWSMNEEAWMSGREVTAV